MLKLEAHGPVRPAASAGDGGTGSFGGRVRRRLREFDLAPIEWVGAITASCGFLAEVRALTSDLRVLLLLVVMFVGIGSSILTWVPRLPKYAAFALSPVVGLAVIVLITVPAAFNHSWAPHRDLALLSGAILAGMFVHRWRRVRSRRGLAIDDADTTVDFDLSVWARFRAQLSGIGRAPLVVYTAATLCWWWSLRTVGTVPLSTYGLLKAASPTFAISILLTLVGAILAVRNRSWVGVFSGAVLLALIERMTVALASTVPMYPWSYKHIAVSDYINRYGYVIRGADIYQSWPGFFTVSAWVTRITGAPPIAIGHWFTLTVHLLGMLGMFAVARAWGADNLGAAVAALMFEMLSFVAQDYYSPQAGAYLLALGILCLLGLSRDRPTGVFISLVLFGAIVMSHQLTPYWLILVVTALVIFRRTRPFWLPLGFVAIAGFYLLYNYATAHKYGGNLVSVDPLANVKLGAKAVPVFGIRLGFYLTECLYAVLFVTSLVTVLATIRHWRRAPIGQGILALGPVLILGFQGYGGEAIFRVYLYALPGILLLVAPLVRRLILWNRFGTGVGTALVLLGGLAAAQVYFGSWFAYRVSPNDLAVGRYFLRNETPTSFFTPVSPGWPSRSDWRYLFHATHSPEFDSPYLSSTFRLTTSFNDKSSYDDFVRAIVLSRGKNPTFVALSPQTADYGYLFGVITADAITNLEKRMLHDNRFVVVFRSGDSILFRLQAS